MGLFDSSGGGGRLSVAHPWLRVGIITCQCTNRPRKPSGARLRLGFSSVFTGFKGRKCKARAVPAALGCRSRRSASSEPGKIIAAADTGRDSSNDLFFFLLTLFWVFLFILRRVRFERRLGGALLLEAAGGIGEEGTKIHPDLCLVRDYSLK